MGITVEENRFGQMNANDDKIRDEDRMPNEYLNWICGLLYRIV